MAVAFSLKTLTSKVITRIEKECILTSRKSSYGDSQKIYCYEIDHTDSSVYVALGTWRKFLKKFPWTKEDYPPTKVRFLGKLMTPETDTEKGYRDQTYVSSLIKQKLEEEHTAFLAAATGFGKCFHPDQLLVMADRSLKRAGDIVTGDLLLGDDWLPRVVTSTITGIGKMYQVIVPLPGQEQGAIVMRCNEDHILCLRSMIENPRMTPIIEISVKDYLELPTPYRSTLGLYSLPQTDPYRVPFMAIRASELGGRGLPLSPRELAEWTCMDLHLYSRCFFRAFSDRNFSFPVASVSPEGLASFLEASRRAGILVTIVKNETEPSGRVWVHPTDTHQFFLKEVGEGEYAGFTVSGTNQRFFLDNGIITHNTTIGCEIAAKSKVKVAVLCFLDIVRKQWVKALQTKTSGKVQVVTKNELDPEADFYVIGVTKSSKIPRDQLSQIGGVIVDEAHLTVKETFEKALLRFQPLWVLGLSATPRRADGLHSVLEMYFGPKKNFITRRETKPFRVYKIETNFVPKIEYVYRGPRGKTLDFGTVIASLAESPERRLFITKRLVQVLQDPEEYLLILTLRVEEGLAIARLLREALEEGRWTLGPTDQPVIEVFGKQKGGIIEGTMSKEDLEKATIVTLRKLAKINALPHEGIDKVTLRKLLIKYFSSPGTKLIIEAKGGIRGIDRKGVVTRYSKIPPEAGLYRVQVVGMKKGGVGYDDPTRTSEAIIDSVRDVEQYEGRVRMKDCSIYDFVDDLGTLEKHWSDRQKHYIAKGAEIIIEKSAMPRTSKRAPREVFIPGRYGY